MEPLGGYSTVNDCIVYVSSVANASKHSRKVECLEAVAVGAKAAGATSYIEKKYNYTPSKLAVMLGWATTNTGGKNIALRKQIIAEQQRRGLKTMCIDASCFKYIDDGSRYLRYSIGGPFYDRAEYANRNSDAGKWQKISKDLGLTLALPNAPKNGYILICMQRDGGFAMKSLDPLTWLDTKVAAIRAVTSRHIMIRPHPGQYSMTDFAKWHHHSNVSVVHPEKTKLVDNLKLAHSAVFFNSSASVAAVLAGIPIFVDDQSCVSWAVANKDVANIESPLYFERDQWLYDLSAAHWSDSEVRSGALWNKFKQFL